MVTERDAFVGCLAKFTGLSTRREMMDKNILCTQALLELGLKEGNYLKESWYYVLDCISKINYFLTKGAGVKQDFEVFSNQDEDMRQ